MTRVTTDLGVWAERPSMTEGRLRTKIPAVFRAGEMIGRGEVRNVSEGGLFVGTQSLPEEGSSIVVKLSAPGKIPVQVTGLVWWTTSRHQQGTRHCGFGLRILDDGAGFQRLLQSVR